jgi:hypothetical protein
MCLPVAGVAAVAGVLQGVVGFIGQQQQYQAEQKAYDTNVRNTQTATFDRYDAINTRVAQENAAKSQELQQANIQGAQARASARTAAVESHVAGPSVVNVLSDMYASEGRFVRATNVNFDYTRDYFKGEGAAARASGQSQINSMPHPTPPNPLAAVLNIFGQAVQGYANAQQPPIDPEIA